MPMQHVLSGFGLVTGATYPLRALRLLQRAPRLWRYLLIPIAVNGAVGIALYAGLLYFGWQGISVLTQALSAWVDGAIAALPDWLSVLEGAVRAFGWVLRLLLAAAILLLTGFALVQFGSVLGSPWYGQLSEEVERYRLGQARIVPVGIARDIGRALLFELQKLAFAASAGLVLLLVNIVPGLGSLVASAGSVAIAATVLCLDFFDGPLERRRLRFRDKLKLVYDNLPASGSFSLVCLVLVSVPLLNLLTVPLCMAAGTLFVCDRGLPRLPERSTAG